MHKKIFLGTVLLFILRYYNFALPKHIFDSSFETNFGIKTSTLNELVFENNERISQLTWNNQFIPQLGINSTMRFWHIFLSGEYITSIPIKYTHVQ